jgi:FkbM family methyltransferase
MLTRKPPSAPAAGMSLKRFIAPWRNPASPPQNPGLIYDVGMNNGDDCVYYLKKGHRVVAIEANPALCAAAERRFAAEIDSGALTILNIGIADMPGEAEFFVHRANSVLSTFVPPGQRIGYTATLPPGEFDVITVELRRLSDVIRFLGAPHYVKIDIEGFDERCLADLHQCGIRPPFISAEAHTIETFCHLVTMGYREFRMVAGATVHQDYAAHPINVHGSSPARHDFPPHAAGPYGDDLPGAWLDKDAILAVWLARGEGWFDLHARMAPR